MEQPLLLVIDDEPAIAQLISDHFEDWFQVNMAHDAKTGLRLSRAKLEAQLEAGVEGWEAYE